MAMTRNPWPRRGALLSACVALFSLAACGSDDGTAPRLGTPPSLGISAPVGLLHTLTLDFADGLPVVSIRSNRYFCSGRTLLLEHLPDSTGMVQLSGADACGRFRFDLQYVSAGACRSGGLYFVDGSLDGVRLPSGPRVLASWDERRRPVEPWITPYDAPILVGTSASRVPPAPEPPFTELGRWVYGIEYVAPRPPTGCSLATAVELVLESAEDSANPRVHRYTITESGAGGESGTTITAATAGAPVPVIERTDGTVRLTFPEFDALRESKARAGLAFPEWNPGPAGVVGTAPSVPLVRVTEPVNLVPSRQEGRPLEAYLFSFLEQVLAPYRTVAVDPGVTMQAEVSLRVPVGENMFTTLPVLLVPAIRLPREEGSTCAPAPPGSVVCTIVAAVKAFDQAQRDLAPTAIYEFRFVFLKELPMVPLLEIGRAYAIRAEIAALR